MMNKQLLTTVTLWFALSSFSLHAQNEKATAAYAENVVVHINTDFLITGESLYYSIHCLDAEKNRPSVLSKLAYVELIGENEKAFLQTKVSLAEGRGAGDFFIPSTLPSGNYTLIAYTKWMRNFPVENFFQRQITIINPYLKPPASEKQQAVDKIIVSIASREKIKNETSQVHFSSDQKLYSPRHKVVVVIQNDDPVHNSNISLNVHLFDKGVEKISALSKPDSRKNVSVNSSLQRNAQPENEFVTFLPDLRGETIGGVVKESSSHRPIVNTTIYLSARGSSIFQISRTDSAGRFYFNAKNIQTQTGIQFQVDWPVESEVILDDEFVNDYKKFKPLPLSIDTTVRKQIEKRNVYSQIENAYFIKKRDSVLISVQEPFFGTPDKVYKLDDFTRFSTMEDIFREYMYEVVVSKRNEKFSIQLINNRNGFRFSNTPLILIDGIRVVDTETLMNYNPLLIKTVSLIRSTYIYAGILFEGILSVNTYTGNAKDLPIAPIQKEYTSWQPSRKYYSPVYNGTNLDKIPDFRVQLYWNPSINLEPGQKFIGEFYTSDVDGNFLIEVNGFTSNGDAVNVRDLIEVKK